MDTQRRALLSRGYRMGGGASAHRLRSCNRWCSHLSQSVAHCWKGGWRGHNRGISVSDPGERGCLEWHARGMQYRTQARALAKFYGEIIRGKNRRGRRLSFPFARACGVGVLCAAPCQPGLSWLPHGPYSPGGVCSCPSCGMAELSTYCAPYQYASVSGAEGSEMA